MPGRIVVGADGSAGPPRALRCAIDEAVIRGVRVSAVVVWRDPVDADELDMLWTDFGPRRTGRFAAVEEGDAVNRAIKRLTAALVEVAGQGPPVQIEPLVVEGDPAQTLCRRCVVCGAPPSCSWWLSWSREARGAVPRVGEHACSHHSRCPLVIIRQSAGSPFGPGSRDKEQDVREVVAQLRPVRAPP